MSERLIKSHGSRRTKRQSESAERQTLRTRNNQDRLALAEFLGMVSHELRTPLSAIKGSVDTLLEVSAELDPAGMTQFFRIIRDQSESMRHLIGDLLDLARIETGTLPVSPEPELVHRVSRLRRRAGAAELLAGWFPLVAKTRRRLGPHPFATVRLKHCSSLARRRSCVLQILGECRRRSRYGGRGRHSPTSGRRWCGGFPNSPSV